MGIKNLFSFLKSKQILFPVVSKQPWPEGASIAIDVPILVHKFMYVHKTMDGVRNHFLQFASTLKKTCTPIFVFDGAPLPLKGRERVKRNEARNKQLTRAREKNALQSSSAQFSTTSESTAETTESAETIELPTTTEPFFDGILWPTKEDYIALQTLLQDNAYDVRIAKFEAEALCSFLTKQDIAWAVLTEDSDVLAFGAKRALFHYFSATGPQLCELSVVLDTLQMTELQFREFCCLLGNDFIENIYNIGPVNAHKLIKVHGSFHSIYEGCRFGWQPKTRESADQFFKEFPEVLQCFNTCCYESESFEGIQTNG